ncbi:Tn3 family transposase [Lamprobacter modestohalophilus]|uniref:Tn3 family transposase n=1 Tax=Lamprobacter modestohalophilus TaxID=1064514 RepID=UPI003D18C2D0
MDHGETTHGSQRASVDRWTVFLEQFTYLRTGLPSEDPQDLLTVILSEKINQGLTRMAEAVPGSSLKRLSHVVNGYVREECYSRALTEIVNQQHGMELATHWGNGTTSSSDGLPCPLGSARKALGHRNPKCDSEPVVIFYTHIPDQTNALSQCASRSSPPQPMTRFSGAARRARSSRSARG